MYPIFSTAQNVAFEDSVTAGDWRLTRQQDGLYERLYNVSTDPLERAELGTKRPEILQCLHATLMEFRNNQLGYYAHPGLVKSYYPPAADWPDIPACSVLRADPCALGHCR